MPDDLCPRDRRPELFQLVAARLAAVRALRDAGDGARTRSCARRSSRAMLDREFARRAHACRRCASTAGARLSRSGTRWRWPRPWRSAIPTGALAEPTRRRAGDGAVARGRDARELLARCASACPMNLRRAYRGFVRADARCWRTSRGSRRCGGGAGAHGPTGRGSSAANARRRLLRAGGGADRQLRAAGRARRHGLCRGASRRPRVPRVAGAGLADPFVQAHYDLDLPERPWPGPPPTDQAEAAALRAGSRASIQPTMSASTPSLPMSFRRSW